MAVSARDVVMSGGLPQPRSSPLRPGSTKEELFRSFVDARVLAFQRKFAKRFVVEDGDAEIEKGYESMTQVVVDLKEIIDVVWVSNTPTLQTPYLMTLAELLVTALPAFPPAASRSLALLRVLDDAFAHLLAIPIRESGAVKTTELIRIRSIAERTRIEVSRSQGSVYEAESDEDTEEKELEMGQCYEKTLSAIGLRLASAQ